MYKHASTPIKTLLLLLGTHPHPPKLPSSLSPRPEIRPKSTLLPPRPKPPPDSEIEESYLRGSGPGGQKINKTSSAVQLIHIPTGLVVKSQATRSRSQNRTIARRLLAEKIDNLRNGDESRAAIVGLQKKKRADSAAKKSRRKHRKLQEQQSSSTSDSLDKPSTTTKKTRRLLPLHCTSVPVYNG
ncbi:hypothetical protein L249_6285 [Ophiocordyceps polyrhachis-furcata BCC 54312]|uniref:Prokaryotic-type class I peptide chain release factors domain-containing protein n=1 Tax=Ophiocordyceps polyrhachis-furcata BCC 54312 TaxID=1330021 RepID=A0A367L177_9HYPO|nr:hypothetical protein L249_6285 [Ophiocordyceps polyrhachis-furcata BCC 54312]